MNDKASLRQQFLLLRAAITPEIARAAAHAVIPLLQECIPAHAAVAGYAAIRGELDVFPALHALHANHHTTLLPCVVQGGKPLLFREYHPHMTLSKDAFGIACPPENAAVVTPDILLVPLVAFDRTRHRLGYGGGYYDRTLAALRAQNPAIRAIGMAYACQEIDALIPEAHDIPLDQIITEHGIIT